tara:strand:- start:1124 stop:1771 length:648 start_codon:yes stop_codon:yes gene_type:complete
MINNENNKNAFINSLGSVGRLKGNWQNYPTASPKDNRQGTINEQLDYWQGQKRNINLDQKQKDYIISSLEMELQILNYKNFIQYAKDQKHKRMVNYFRSTLQKRIIGCHIICETLKGKWTLQSEIHQIYNINRSAISSIIKECLEESWFISKICEDNFSNQLCYQCNDTMLQRTADYNIWKFKTGNNPKIVNFVKHYNNSIFNQLLDKSVQNLNT